jgi:hypothetical protein
MKLFSSRKEIRAGLLSTQDSDVQKYEGKFFSIYKLRQLKEEGSTGNIPKANWSPGAVPCLTFKNFTFKALSKRSLMIIASHQRFKSGTIHTIYSQSGSGFQVLDPIIFIIKYF